MIGTQHSMQRMSQRGITMELIDMVYKYGKPIGNKVELDKKTIQKFIDELDYLKKTLLKVQDKNGVCIVIRDDKLITTYSKTKD